MCPRFSISIPVYNIAPYLRECLDSVFKQTFVDWQSSFGMFYEVANTAKVSVPEWLAKIAASDFVFTNSFHGTVFAILFHRPFVSILLRGPMSGMNERALSLLKKLGLESRAVYANDTAAIEAALASPIDWEKVDSARVACAEGSRRFINDCL